MAVSIDAVPSQSAIVPAPSSVEAKDAADLEGRAIAINALAQLDLSLAFDPPSDERGILANPLGVYVTAITWSQRL